MYTPSSFSTFGKYEEDKYESGGGNHFEYLKKNTTYCILVSDSLYSSMGGDVRRPNVPPRPRQKFTSVSQSQYESDYTDDGEFYAENEPYSNRHEQ